MQKKNTYVLVLILAGLVVISSAILFDSNSQTPKNNTILPKDDNENNVSISPIKYYGYYYVEDVYRNIHRLDEVRNYTNTIRLIAPNPFTHNNLLNQSVADKINQSGSNVILQMIYGDEAAFTSYNTRDRYYRGLRTMIVANTTLLRYIRYIEIWDEPYTHVEQGLYDNWSIFRGKTKDEKIEIMREKLNEMANHIRFVFTGVRVTITENNGREIFLKNSDGTFRYPPPENADMISIDPHFYPTSGECDDTQRSRFDQKMTPALEWAKSANKSIQIAAQSFTYTNGAVPDVIPSACQMQWYYEIASNPDNNVISLMWFMYSGLPDQHLKGVGDDPIFYTYQLELQRKIGREILAR